MRRAWQEDRSGKATASGTLDEIKPIAAKAMVNEEDRSGKATASGTLDEMKPIAKLSSPNKLFAYLDEIGTSPKKRLSQNFLTDENILKKIIAISTLSSEEVVLEIGPGPGALTDVLLASQAKVIAIEKDPVLAEALEKRKGNLTVFCQDILEVDLEALFGKGGSFAVDQKKVKVIANLPYHLTTPILVRFLPMHSLFSSLIVMVQKEVAERLTAPPGSKTYGSLTVLAHLYSTPRFGFRVSRHSFYPKPGVDSAVVRFDLHPPPKEVEDERFFKLTRTAFGKRRKMLTSSLSSLYSKEAVAAALKKLSLSEKARPEVLSAEQFIQLFQLLNLKTAVAVGQED